MLWSYSRYIFLSYIFFFIIIFEKKLVEIFKKGFYVFFVKYFCFNNSIEKKVGENFEKGFEDYVYKS